MADPLGPLAWGPLPPLHSTGPEAVKMGSLATLLAATLLGGLMPLRLFPPGSSALRRESLGLLGRFTTGVFLAACLLDLLPNYLGAIKGALDELRVTLLFPLPEFILSMGFFLVLILEQILVACKEPQEEEEESKETPWSPSAPIHEDPPSGLRLGALLLSLCLSSGLQGFSVRVLEPCTSLLLHQGLLAFALGLRLAQGGLRGRAVAAGVALFATSAPLGLALGAALAQEGAGPSSSPLSRLSCSVLQGLAAGAFLHLSCTEEEALPHGTRSGIPRRRQRILRAVALLAGFALLTSLLFFGL